MLVTDFKSYIEIITDKQRNDRSLLLLNRIKEYQTKKSLAATDVITCTDSVPDVEVDLDADVDLNTDNSINFENIELPPEKVEIDLENNSKKVITYSLNEEGKIVKTTREYNISQKKYNLPKAVAQRREWTKFGVSAGLAPGPDASSTSTVCDEVFFEITYKSKIQDDTQDDSLGGVNIFGGSKKKMECKYCKGAHWSMKCPNRHLVNDNDGKKQGTSTSNGKFVPSHLRNGNALGNKNENTIRVSNISDNATEKDIRLLFDRFGYIKRLHYKRGKGYSFITFDTLSSCEEAIKNVDRHPYDYLILSVEMASNK
tara:strand:- start:49 stop:990 length:942 start_codon:yes stop_codon:yes gene_type:complete